MNSKYGAVLFSGPSGIGKSTLLGELLNRGYEMMVDDICAVTVDQQNQPEVLPGYPRTRVWADSAKKLDVSTEGLARIRESIEKYERQVNDKFFNKRAHAKHIFVLGFHNESEISIDELVPIDKFSAVLNNTYQNVFLDGLELKDVHFLMVSKIAQSVTIHRVKGPSGAFKIAELADEVEAVVEGS